MSLRFRTKIVHWRYEDGWREIPNILRSMHAGKEREFQEDQKGWHCWVYPGDELRKDALENRDFFVEWMKENMKGYYEADHRFNSGDPMYTVFIKEEEDATLFKLRWP